MKPAIHNDRIAVVLRNHFQTEESDAGLRSPGFESSPKASASPDAAFVARADSDRQGVHRRCRAALAQLQPYEREILLLAYGLHLRSREIDDEGGRHAPKKSDRDWRVVLREIYGIGDVVGIVLRGRRISYLLSEAGRNCKIDIITDAIDELLNARNAFAKVYEPPNGEERLDAPKKRKRGRTSEREIVRHSAFGGIHDLEFWR